MGVNIKIKRAELILFIAVLLVSAYFSLYHLERIYSIGSDQQRDAFVMWDLLRNGKLTLIGPRVVGLAGFFLGPLWYYLLAPFYFLSRLDPIAAAWFGAFIGVSTTAVSFVLVKKITDTKTAMITSLFWATYSGRIVWNPMLVPMITFLLVYFLFKISKGEKKYVIWTLLLFGLSIQIHFQALFFAIPIAAVLLYSYRKSRAIKETVIGALALAATFAPLALFDIRHDFLNTKSFLAFFSGSKTALHLSGAFSVFIKEIASFLPMPIEVHTSFYIAILLFCLFGLLIGKMEKIIKITLILILFLPPIVFSLYSGILSEYYFTLCLVPLTIGFSVILKKIYSISFIGKALFVFVLFVFLIQRLAGLRNSYDKRSLYFKRQAVKMIVEQNIDPVFNVSYSTPYNEDAGFAYLFKFYGREPQDIPEGHLWTIVIPANGEDVPPLSTFGDIGVIRR